MYLQCNVVKGLTLLPPFRLGLPFVTFAAGFVYYVGSCGAVFVAIALCPDRHRSGLPHPHVGHGHAEGAQADEG